MRRKKQRKVPKVRKYKSVPKAYVSGLKGAKRTQRARDIARMQRLYKAGKRVPRSLMKRIFG
jgi:hypothetical protein|tara:strand:+ start:166 stop:351 length:186 start_codon:yes stop_codon:yes gene_type:complete